MPQVPSPQERDGRRTELADQASSAAVARPNVVVIMADDMGWGDLACYGGRIPTPNMDRLAAEGVRLTDAHSASAVCSPSRYALLTGRYAWRGPLKAGVLLGHGPALIEPDRPTIAGVLHQAGYSTGAFGKWHLGLGWRWRDGHVETAFGTEGMLRHPPEVDAGGDVDYTQPFTGGPLELGFERFFGIAGSLDMPPYCFLDQDRTLGIPDQAKQRYITSQRTGLQTPGWRDDQVDVRFAEEACRWLAARPADGRPFFCYLTPAAPHRPCVPPDFVRGSTGLGNRADAVCLVDWMVGRVLDTLTDIGALDSTLVIVTSDNGAPTDYAEDGDTQTHRPNGPWRGQKGDIWDGGHREPFVARWPGRLPAGEVRDGLFCHADLFTTLANATCAAVPQGAAEDSTDQLSLLTDGHAAPADHAVVHHSLPGRFAIRRGHWKAEFCTGSGGGFSRPKGTPFDAEHPEGQLYEMSNDPEEKHNLWNENPKVVASLYTGLQAICRDESSGLPFGVPV